MRACKSGGKHHLNGRDGAVFGTIHLYALRPLRRAIDIQHLSVRREAGLIARAHVHHFNGIGGGVPLNMQRLGALLRAKITSVRVEEVVIGLPK